MLKQHIHISKCTFSSIFRMMDLNRDGYLNEYEMLQLIRMAPETKNVPELELLMMVRMAILAIDEDGDMRVNFREFLKVNKFNLIQVYRVKPGILLLG